MFHFLRAVKLFQETDRKLRRKKGNLHMHVHMSINVQMYTHKINWQWSHFALIELCIFSRPCFSAEVLIQKYLNAKNTTNFIGISDEMITKVYIHAITTTFVDRRFTILPLTSKITTEFMFELFPVGQENDGGVRLQRKCRGLTLAYTLPLYLSPLYDVIVTNMHRLSQDWDMARTLRSTHHLKTHLTTFRKKCVLTFIIECLYSSLNISINTKISVREETDGYI